MKNIKIISLIAALLLAAMTLSGCIVKVPVDHTGHDHESETVDVSKIFPPMDQIIFPDEIPSINTMGTDKIKSAPANKSTFVLRVVKVEGNMLFCTSGKSNVADYVMLGAKDDIAKEGTYVLCQATSYMLSCKDNGFNAGEIFDYFFVVFGDELTDERILTEQQAAKIFDNENFN